MAGYQLRLDGRVEQQRFPTRLSEIAKPTTNERIGKPRLSELMPQGSIKAHKPNVSEKIGNFIGGTLAKFGVDERHAARIANKFTDALHDLSPSGNVDDFLYGSEFEKQLAILPLPGPAKREVSTALREGIRAWHGSPHDFDKFSLSKIGTGEGAQAYGHGLYFAEEPSVAKMYRDTLAGERVKLGDRAFDVGWHTRSQMSDPAEIAAEAVHRFKGDVPTAIDWLGNAEATQLDRQAAKLLRRYHGKGAVAVEPNPGRLYEVNINAKPEDFLNWDAPLSEQAAGRALAQRDFELASQKRVALGVPSAGFAPSNDWQTVLNHLGPQLPRTASELGIPGIRYLDQGSRGAASGTSNYVVFDDGLIEILNKY